MSAPVDISAFPPVYPLYSAPPAPASFLPAATPPSYKLYDPAPVSGPGSRLDAAAPGFLPGPAPVPPSTAPPAALATVPVASPVRRGSGAGAAVKPKGQPVALGLKPVKTGTSTMTVHANGKATLGGVAVQPRPSDDSSPLALKVSQATAPAQTPPPGHTTVDSATYAEAALRLKAGAPAGKSAAGPTHIVPPEPAALWPISPPSGPKKAKEGTVYKYEAELPLGMRLVSAKRHFVAIDAEPFHTGSQFDIFKCTLLLDANTRKRQVSYVAKRFHDALDIKGYFMKCQLFRSFLTHFNEGREPQAQAKLLALPMLLELSGGFFLLEEEAEGEWLHRSVIAEALSHFSFQHFGHNFMFVEVGGVGPAIGCFTLASQRRHPYGLDCADGAAIELFCRLHDCGADCAALGLAPLPPQGPLPEPQPLDPALAQRGPRPAPPEPFLWLEGNHSHLYNPELQAALLRADRQQRLLRVAVGGVTVSAIDCKRRQSLNVLTGRASYVHRKKPQPPPPPPAPSLHQTFLQVQLEDGWQSYDERVQELVRAAVQSRQAKLPILMNERHYEFDFERLEQLNVDQGTRRKIRFVEFVKCVVTVDPARDEITDVQPLPDVSSGVA